MSSVQSVPGTDGMDIRFAERLALLQVLDHKQRPAKGEAIDLVRGRAELDFAQRSLGCAHRLDHRLELLRFERERAIRPWLRARQGQMFLDDAGAQCNRGNG